MPSGRRLLIQGDLDRLGLTGGDRVERPVEVDRVAAPPDRDVDLDVGLGILALVHDLDVEGEVPAERDARRPSRGERLPAERHAAESGAVEAGAGRLATATAPGPEPAHALGDEVRLEPLDVRQELAARHPDLAAEVLVLDDVLHVRHEALRVDDIARQEGLHLGRDLLGALATLLVAESLGQGIGDPRQAVAAELEGLEEVALCRVDVARVVGVAGAGWHATSAGSRLRGPVLRELELQR